jgi:ribosome-binding factor A
MEFDRHDRARSLMNELIAKFIREEANTTPLITVTNLTISPNYHNVTVFITTIPESDEEKALIFLKRKGGELREYVKKNGRLKFIPFFDFEIDYGERHRQHIDEVVQRIEKKEHEK